MTDRVVCKVCAVEKRPEEMCAGKNLSRRKMCRECYAAYAREYHAKREKRAVGAPRVPYSNPLSPVLPELSVALLELHATRTLLAELHDGVKTMWRIEVPYAQTPLYEKIRKRLRGET